MSSTYFVRPTIPGRYLAELVAQAGVDARRTLESAGLPREAIKLPHFRVSVEQFERFYKASRAACGDEMFGFFTRKAPPGTYAVMMRLATGCRHLGDFFEGVTRLYALFDGGHRHWEIVREKRRASLRLRVRDRVQRQSIFFSHAMLLTAWRSAAWLSGEAIPLDSVRLDPRFRSFARETSFLFGREPELTAGECAVSFDAAWLRAPVRRSPEDADVYVRTSLRSLLGAPAGDTLEALVRAVLAGDRPFAAADLVSVAQRLHVSRATLTRRLAARGLSFQELKDALRRDHAIALLTGRSQVGIGEVAALLGFSEASAFARAFKSWTGVSPGSYRRALRWSDEDT